MSQGWIKIHRQLKECWIWEEKPFDRTHAWLDLLLRANHSEKKVALGNEIINVNRGSFITSELKLVEAWGWSKTKVRSFLKMLQDENMIEIIADKKKTTINIVNYSVYQDFENHENTTEIPQENHEETTKEPRKNTNKNEKNEKNEKNKQQGFDAIINSYSENEELKTTILDFVKMRKTIKKPMTDKALTLMLNKLNTLAVNDLERIAVLNQSIENSWQGIFELKDKPKIVELPQQRKPREFKFVQEG